MADQGQPSLDPRAAGARRFAGKIAIVAGAGQGIGSAAARRLAQEGATVVVADIVEASAERICRQLQEHGARASAFIGDLSEREATQALMSYTKETYGRIDVLVNIVGGTIWWRSFQYYEPQQIELEIKKSFWPSMWLCWSVLPYMIEQRSGSIVNIGTHAVVGRFRVPYAAAKGGVLGLTTSLARELAPLGIRINYVAPSSGVAEDRVIPRDYGVRLSPHDIPAEEKKAIERYMKEERPLEIPMGRPGLAEEQAAAIAFLASDDASYITGQVLPVGGGMVYPF
ncbi:MAG TPA: SDR family NAD(P)-dependent oxidoreductase [Dehalococcoidia bacterium]|nr:SDR family NAD(P)-dependent oxidoreductase [Dehalococcoidia bacterium]